MGTSIEDLTARAKQLIAERRYQEAVRACRRILLSRPAMTEVRILLGMALLALKRHDEVRAEMMAVLRAVPEESVAHRLLGEAHLRDAQVDKARESFKRALELDPSDEEARELLSEVAEEEPVVSETIDRWFDPEAVATQQTDSPEWEEDATESLPAFDVDELRAERDMALGRPRSAPPPPGLGPMGPPPSAPPPRRSPRSSYPAPRGSSFPPPPRAEAPSSGMAGAPRRPMSAHPPSSMPPPPRVPNFPVEEHTAAHTPQAKHEQSYSDPDTSGGYDELSLSDVSEVESPIRPNPYLAPSRHGPSDDFDDDIPTHAMGGPGYADPVDYQQTSARPVLDELPGEKTTARPRSAPPPAFAPGGPADYGLPSVVAHDGYGPPPGQHDPMGGPGAPAGPYPPHGGPMPTPHMPLEAQPAAPRPKKKKKGRSRVPLFLAGVFVPLLIGVVGVSVATWWLESTAEEEIRAAVTRADDDGLRTTLDGAIGLVEEHDDDDPEDLALRARLYAVLVLDHGETEKTEAADALLGELDPEQGRHADAIIASTYLSLARGDVERAKATVASEPSDEVSAAELARAEALALAAGGEYARAFAASEDARQLRPESPRHVALNAFLTAHTDDVQAGLTLLSAVPGGEASPAIRIARARIVKHANSDPDLAAAEATEVIETLEGTATPPQLAWAHLVRAWHGAMHGDLTRAVAEGTAAREVRPPGDESFALELTEVLVKASAFDAAAQTLDALPEVSVQPALRARLTAAVALGRGQIEAAAAALADAGDGARSEFMRGRVAEANLDVEEAEGHYRAAMSLAPELRPQASARLGAIAAENGDHAEAVDLLRPMAEQFPSNIEVVPLLVESLLALDRADDAARILERAFAVSRPPGVDVSIELLVSRSKLEMARGDKAGAMATLQQVVEQRPTFADHHRTLGEAALAAGEYAVARQAFERVQELIDGNDGPALAGLAYLAVAEGADLEAALAAIAAAEEAGGSGSFLDQAKARVMVAEGKGHEAAELIRPMVRGSEDAGLWVALGQARLQAVADRQGGVAFERVLELDENNPDALIGLAHIRIRAGSTDRASRFIRRAEAAVRARSLGASYEARIKAADGRVQFELGRFDSARELANEAVRLDGGCGDAHLLLASVAMENNSSGTDELRRAVEATPPSVEAMGLLAIELSSRRNEESCAIAQRYLAAAPQGLDARVVRRFARRCR